MQYETRDALMGEDLGTGIRRKKRHPGERISTPGIAAHEEIHLFPEDIPPLLEDADREVKCGSRPDKAASGALDSNFRT